VVIVLENFSGLPNSNILILNLIFTREEFYVIIFVEIKLIEMKYCSVVYYSSLKLENLIDNCCLQ